VGALGKEVITPGPIIEEVPSSVQGFHLAKKEQQIQDLNSSKLGAVARLCNTVLQIHGIAPVSNEEPADGSVIN
jgi:hypothetical protein